MFHALKWLLMPLLKLEVYKIFIVLTRFTIFQTIIMINVDKKLTERVISKIISDDYNFEYNIFCPLIYLFLNTDKTIKY